MEKEGGKEKGQMVKFFGGWIDGEIGEVERREELQLRLDSEQLSQSAPSLGRPANIGMTTGS